MKKAISLLLILTTLLGCCSLFFACKDDDDDSVDGVKTLDNKSETVLDITTVGLAAGETRNDEPTALWALKKGNNEASSRTLSLTLANKGLSDYKEVTFLMDNTSDEAFEFNFYFVDEDGKTYRAQTDIDIPWVERSSGGTFTDPGTPVITDTVNKLICHPGLHQYTVPLDEVDVLSGQKRVDYNYNKETGKTEIKFDKSKLVGIKIDASTTNINSDINVHIGSVKANSNKYGTIKGFGIKKISNAVCFFKESNFYMYDQLRYCLVDDEAAQLGIANDSVYVPVAVLAQHRGATISVNTVDEVTFTYEGTQHTFKAGDKFTYTANIRGYNAGKTMEGTTSSIGKYLTIPMEVAASVLKYQLFYDVSGLAIFSDRPLPETVLEQLKLEDPIKYQTIADLDWEGWKDGKDKYDMMYVDPLDTNYYESNTTDTIPDRQLGNISQICKIITFDYYTGKDLLEDMDKLYGDDVHGNLIVSKAQFAKLREYTETDPTYKSWLAALEKKYGKGSEYYTKKLPTWGTSDGYRLDSGDTTSLRMYAFLYRLTDNEDYAERAIALMEAYLKYKDPVSGANTWNTGEYLSCAEIMYTYTLAFDWCYEYIKEDKDLLKKFENGAWTHCYGAIIGHGDHFEFWRDNQNVTDYNTKNATDDDPDTVNSPWGFCTIPYKTSNLDTSGIKSPTHLNYKTTYNKAQFLGNWNAVCNNAMIQVAFAFQYINEETRAASEYILTFALNDTTYAMTDCYSPDGGHPEGPGYWYFGTKDQMVMLETIKNCTGSYHGLNDYAGFEDSYYYVMGSASPHSAWNYHDCTPEANMNTAEFFMAGKMFNNPALAQYRYSEILQGISSVGIWDMAFYDPAICYENTNLELDLDYISYKIGIATFRSDWTTGQMYTGIHGGASNAGHGQLDIGNFILEYNGTRFFMDHGSDSYVMPGYFSYPARHWIYVNRAEGHSTLVINPQFVVSDQNNNGKTNDEWGTASVNVYSCDYWQRNETYQNYDQSFYAISNILDYKSVDAGGYAVVDMGCAYAFYDRTLEKINGGLTITNDKGKVNNPNAVLNMVTPTGVRGLMVTDNRSTVIIQDELDISCLPLPNNPSSDEHTVLWNGQVIKGGTITISKDAQIALITFNGNTLMCEIVTPENEEHPTPIDPTINPDVTWSFESRAADYLRETGLFLQAGEYNRDGKQKLVAVAKIKPYEYIKTDEFGDPVYKLNSGNKIPATSPEQPQVGGYLVETATYTAPVKMAVVCRLLSAGPHSYTWTDIEDWETLF